jgi:DNA polymerase bacteriophage-type
MEILYRDFESRSTIDLTKVGAYRYATDPSTSVLCCAYAVNDGPIKLWEPGDPVPQEWIEAARNPSWVVSAFNDQFERFIEAHIMAPRYGWPIIPIDRHRCTQASALSRALPAKLAGVAKALDLAERKDDDGALLMAKMCKPRGPHKDENPAGIYWFDDEDRLQRLYAYCRQDVEVERAIWRKIGFISPAEQKIWELDAIVNDRGIYTDQALLTAAIDSASNARNGLNAELKEVTGGRICTVG